MMHRRGLTLLEILIATVMLAALAVTCASLLRDASTALREPPPEVDLFDLMQLADEILADPEAHGTSIDRDSLTTPMEIDWPDRADRLPITLHALVTDDSFDLPSREGSPTAAHHPAASMGTWLVFAYEPWHVFRWVPDEAAEQDDGAVAGGGR